MPREGFYRPDVTPAVAGTSLFDVLRGAGDDGAGSGDDVGSVGVPGGAALAAVDSDDAGREGRPLAVAGRMGCIAAAEVIGHVGARPEADVMALFRAEGLA